MGADDLSRPADEVRPAGTGTSYALWFQDRTTGRAPSIFPGSPPTFHALMRRPRGLPPPTWRLVMRTRFLLSALAAAGLSAGPAWGQTQPGPPATPPSTPPTTPDNTRPGPTKPGSAPATNPDNTPPRAKPGTGPATQPDNTPARVNPARGPPDPAGRGDPGRGHRHDRHGDRWHGHGRDRNRDGPDREHHRDPGPGAAGAGQDRGRGRRRGARPAGARRQGPGGQAGGRGRRPRPPGDLGRREASSPAARGPEHLELHEL